MLHVACLLFLLSVLCARKPAGRDFDNHPAGVDLNVTTIEHYRVLLARPDFATTTIAFLDFQCYYCPSGRIKSLGVHDMPILDDCLDVFEAAAILGVQLRDRGKVCVDKGVLQHKKHTITGSLARIG